MMYNSLRLAALKQILFHSVLSFNYACISEMLARDWLSVIEKTQSIAELTRIEVGARYAMGTRTKCLRNEETSEKAGGFFPLAA